MEKKLRIKTTWVSCILSGGLFPDTCSYYLSVCANIDLLFYLEV